MHFLGYSWSTLLLIVAVIGTFLFMWGTNTNGTLRQYVQASGALLMIVSIVWAIVSNGFLAGLIMFVGLSFLAGVASRLIPTVR